MTARSRFSSDGQFLAIAKLSNTHIDIWNANPVALFSISTIELPARRASLSWLGPRPNKQRADTPVQFGFPAVAPHASKMVIYQPSVLSPDGTSLLSVHETGSVVMEWYVTPIMPPATLEVDTSIRFVRAGGYFGGLLILLLSTSSREMERGEERAILTFLPNQTTIVDLDCHPNLPMSCSVNQEGAISLWNMKVI
ncbi:unnamed protein product [Peronospora destructor]|uniref:Uncharacterized protein n=1 Tax=Peronospora destructor TaxID=86335 RepID=A0AAV0SWA4_9STRA|nr:unnamed protein product [Peronospora destructor]